MTVKDLEEKLGAVCRRDSIWVILKDMLNYHKVFARWVPKQLTEDYKRQRIECAEEVVRHYEEEKNDFFGLLS